MVLKLLLYMDIELPTVELLEDEEEKNSRIEICNHYSFSIPKEEISILKKGILIDAENL